jgi:hypothetical protein
VIVLNIYKSTEKKKYLTKKKIKRLKNLKKLKNYIVNYNQLDFLKGMMFVCVDC